MAKLTLLTACYNSAETVGDTLKSVNAQNYANIEHIIIDGASRDNTVDICETLGTRVTKIVSERDKGIYDAYNKGLTHATGDIVGFINSDDYYATGDVCSEVMAAFEDPSVDAVHADLVYVNATQTDIVERHWQSKPITRKALSSGFIPAHPTVFLRREVYDRVGNFDLTYRLAADYEFLLRTFYTHEVSSCYIPQIWVRMRSGGATGGNVKSILRQNNEIRAAQQKHGVSCSTARFYTVKIADRLMQRVRAQKAKAPDLLAAR
ncbi:glycosyltransferase family 2 protein [Meridianimarinicoccus aquatilis]|uniref:Glycosyltransferase n=1 Tax=Meridianimarinicoccus aquatilis TaxID=2552766 RepID=A0A4R6B0Z5_9RHOB|nr:glycosyltransferase family 2 protein [Fluviibacterium aquatile]TDL88143.1 glycosyltransferase [Fluviibacterium aquatile]